MHCFSPFEVIYLINVDFSGWPNLSRPSMGISDRTVELLAEAMSGGGGA